jgi:phenylalanyl-tRNA synthetase beta chain
MKILKSWLEDYIDKKISNKRLEEIFINSGLEVEAVETSIDDKVVVAKIKDIYKHPNADKLKLVALSVGDQEVKVVCGANNIETKQIVPLALPGAKIQGEILKEAVIRGERSFGMLCSEKELGLGDDHSGIKILSDELIPGERVNRYIACDTVFDLSVSANRGDCLSHLGVSREICAYEKTRLTKEPVKLSKTDSNSAFDKLSLKVGDASLCPQYYARLIEGVKIGPSPKWLQERLIACGAKPINNVVDITNFILLDLGYPMHAFDYKKIKDKKIIVRTAKNNEEIITLDGELRNLNNKSLVIADSEKPIAIAGIMGGENSEVDESTDAVVLEAAQFNSKNIRETSKYLNLKTEASYRFERGIDSGGIEYAINKAANLITQVAGGRILSGIVSSGDVPEKNFVIANYDKIRDMLGIKISNDKINYYLKLLGFEIESGRIAVPFWRHDIMIWQDIAEEVGRLFGYEKVSRCKLEKINPPKKSSFYFQEKIKDFMILHGYSESINYPFLSEKIVSSQFTSQSQFLKVENPLQPENRYLRDSIIPSLLGNISKNSAFDDVKLYEIGHTFFKTKEQVVFSFVSSEKNYDQFIMFLNKFLDEFRIDKKYAKVTNFSRDDLYIYKIKRPTLFAAEINISGFLSANKFDQDIKLANYSKEICYRGVSKYPAVTRDLAFLFDKSINAGSVSKAIYRLSGLVNRVELFDEFCSDKFGKNKKSMAFHLFLQSFKNTLTDKEADSQVEKIISGVEKEFNAKIRS